MRHISKDASSSVVVVLEVYDCSPHAVVVFHFIGTQIMGQYSYVETAALQIGDEVLEVSSYGGHILNGVEDAKLPNTLSGYKVTHEKTSKNGITYAVYIGEYDRILLRNFKKFVAVEFELHTPLFYNSEGLMGNFVTGRKLARDGVTEIADPNAFGREWQVRDTEPKLFASGDRWPQYPDACIIPEHTAEEGRRLLRGVSMSTKAAEAACAHRKEDFEDCVFDVMATGDLDMAESEAA